MGSACIMNAPLVPLVHACMRFRSIFLYIAELMRLTKPYAPFETAHQSASLVVTYTSSIKNIVDNFGCTI